MFEWLTRTRFDFLSASGAAALFRFADDPGAVQPSMQNAKLISSIHFTFAPEDADKAQAMLVELRDTSRKEPGVIAFEVARGVEKTNVFALWETYRDKTAYDAHLATDHVKRLVINGLRPLAQERNAVILAPI